MTKTYKFVYKKPPDLRNVYSLLVNWQLPYSWVGVVPTPPGDVGFEWRRRLPF